MVHRDVRAGQQGARAAGDELGPGDIEQAGAQLPLEFGYFEEEDFHRHQEDFDGGMLLFADRTELDSALEFCTGLYLESRTAMLSSGPW